MYQRKGILPFERGFLYFLFSICIASRCAGHALWTWPENENIILEEHTPRSTSSADGKSDGRFTLY